MDPAAFVLAADAAEVREPQPCAICGTYTLREAPANSLATCNGAHARILREAERGESPSTVLLRDVLGGPARLLFRAFAATGGKGVVRVQTIEAAPGAVRATTGTLTPREARRFAGALIRAANRAEDKPANGEIARA